MLTYESTDGHTGSDRGDGTGADVTGDSTTGGEETEEDGDGVRLLIVC